MIRITLCFTILLSSFFSLGTKKALATDPIVATFVGGYLASKVVDAGFDAATGKPNVWELRRQIKLLEDNAAIRGDVKNELSKLRESINEKTSREEFLRHVERTRIEVSSLQRRMEDLEERVELLEVEKTKDFGQLSNNTSKSSYFVRLSKQHLRDENYFRAIACSNIAIELAPNNGEAYAHRASLYWSLGSFGIAVLDYIEFARLCPKETQQLFDVGIEYHKLKRYSDAVTILRLVAKYQPDIALNHYHLSQSLKENGQSEEAVAELSRVISLDASKFQDIYLERGNALMTLRWHYVRLRNETNEFEKYDQLITSTIDKAVDDYTVAIKRNPNDKNPLVQRAVAFVAQSSGYSFYKRSESQYAYVQKAIADLLKAAELDEEDSDLWFKMARYQFDVFLRLEQKPQERHAGWTKKEELQKIEKYISNAIAREKNDFGRAPLFLFRRNVYSWMNEHEKGVADCKSAIACCKDASVFEVRQTLKEAYSHLSFHLRSLDKLEAANEALEKSWKFD